MIRERVPKVEVHMRLPVSTKARGDEMAADDAAPHDADFGRFVASLIEAEWARRQRKANACPGCDGEGYRDGPTCPGCGLSFECCPECNGSGQAPSKLVKKGRAT